MTGGRPQPLTFSPLPERPLVSVVMPAYNAERFLLEAFVSLLSQTYSHWELLLLDDGSTDGTSHIIAGLDDERVRKFSNAQNDGYLRSCNRLFSEAKGDLVTFLDADDTCVPQRLEVCVTAFSENPVLGFLSTDFCRTDIAGTILTTEHHAPDYGRYAMDPEYYPTVCCATIMLRRELLNKVGGYHPFFERLGGEDYHWLFHLARRSKGIHLRTETYLYRSHPAQTHLCNSHPLKYFTEDIDKQLRREKLINGKDGLENVQALREKWERFVKANPQETAYRKATLELNQGDQLKAVVGAFHIIAVAPWQAMAWKRAVYLVYSLVRRVIRPIG
ncbi:MAG: glycosyltransferase [Flavobacteriales bacterium]|nr:glycosyltransferase [Flavobacteriales bacterium]